MLLPDATYGVENQAGTWLEDSSTSEKQARAGQNRRVAVVGGGEDATRKVRHLAGGGAQHLVGGQVVGPVVAPGDQDYLLCEQAHRQQQEKGGHCC